MAKHVETNQARHRQREMPQTKLKHNINIYIYVCIDIYIYMGMSQNRSAPSFQILIQKNGFGALNSRHPYFETYTYIQVKVPKTIGVSSRKCQISVVVHLSSLFICSGVNHPDSTDWVSSFLFSMIFTALDTKAAYI